MSFASREYETGVTIIDVLRRRAASDPKKTAYIHLASDSEREGLTYRELDRCAAGIAAWLIERGAKDQRVMLVHPTGLDFIAAFFGCLYAGAIAVPQSAFLRPRNLGKLAAVAANCDATIALTDSTTLERLAHGEARPAGLDWMASDKIEPRDAAPSIEPPELAYLQYTSGSTAEPRGVRITHANLMAHLRQLVATYEAKDGDAVVTWLPHFHDMGLVGMLLTALYCGGPCVMLPTLSVMQRPVRWLKAISDFRSNFSAAPNFAYELCVNKIAPGEREGLDLSCWRVAFNGAEPVRADTIRRFTKTFAANGFRPETLSPCYGLAEATLMVSSSRPSQVPRIARFERELVSCGAPNDGVDVVIVDPESAAPVAAGKTGEIWVKGPSVADGYFADPQATAATFGAHLADDSGPYLRTGDLGFLHEGELFITGRLKDLIILNGRNLYPQDVEQSAQTGRPDLIAGRGAAFGADAGLQEQLVLVQELHRHAAANAEALITEIRAAILANHEVPAGAILLVAPGTLPITSSGKLARRAAREMFLSGKLAPIAAWYDPAWPQ